MHSTYELMSEENVVFMINNTNLNKLEEIELSYNGARGYSGSKIVFEKVKDDSKTNLTIFKYLKF